MYYLNPEKRESGAYGNMQSNYAPGLLAFPDEFFPEYFKEGKQCAGFVNIEHDGSTVTSCTWDEGAYQAYIATLPEDEPEPYTPTTDERLTSLETALAQTDETAIELYEANEEQQAINSAQDDALIEIYEMIGA